MVSHPLVHVDRRALGLQGDCQAENEPGDEKDGDDHQREHDVEGALDDAVRQLGSLTVLAAVGVAVRELMQLLELLVRGVARRLYLVLRHARPNKSAECGPPTFFQYGIA